MELTFIPASHSTSGCAYRVCRCPASAQRTGVIVDAIPTIRGQSTRRPPSRFASSTLTVIAQAQPPRPSNSSPKSTRPKTTGIQPDPSTGSNSAPRSASGQHASPLRLDPVELGCVSLIAGTCVGAGVLALPAVSAPSGFLPATGALVFVWFYMFTAAMLSAEVSVNASCILSRPDGISLLSQARLTLGPVGATIASCSYVVLHYAVLVAYTSQGAVVGEQLLHMSHPVAGAVFLLTLASALYAFSEEQIDAMNNVLFVGVVTSFVAVLAALAPAVHPATLAAYANVAAVPRAVPTLLLSCVYHNVIGSVATRLDGDVDRVRRVVLTGSGVPLVMFVAANAIVLAATGARMTAGESGIDPLADLAAGGGLPRLAISSFSLLAVATSALGFVEGLNQLWNDARISLLGEEPVSVARNALPSYGMTVVVPIVVSAYLPGSFLSAIDTAGLYGVSVLFGFLPAAMAWRQRYGSDAGLATAMNPAVPGGKLVLAIMMALPSILIVYSSWRLFGR